MSRTITPKTNPTDVTQIPLMGQMVSICTPALLAFTINTGSGIYQKSVTIIAAMNKARNRYTASSVTIETPFEQIDYQSTRLPVQTLLAQGLKTELLKANSAYAKEYPALDRWAHNKRGRKPSKKATQYPDEALLREAGIVMLFDRLVGGKPVQAMARAMGLTHADARRWSDKIRRNRF